MILGVVLQLAFLLAVMLGFFLPLVAWLERKQGALMQDRIGPDRADFFGVTAAGLLQPLADAVKLLAKEDVVPQGARRWGHRLAPVVAFVPVLVMLAVLPYGGRYRFGDATVGLVVADVDWGVLLVLAAGALAALGPVMAGWASHSEWGMLGALRAAAQAASYQVAMGLSHRRALHVLRHVEAHRDGTRPGRHLPGLRLRRIAGMGGRAPLAARRARPAGLGLCSSSPSASCSS